MRTIGDLTNWLLELVGQLPSPDTLYVVVDLAPFGSKWSPHNERILHSTSCRIDAKSMAEEWTQVHTCALIIPARRIRQVWTSPWPPRSVNGEIHPDFVED